MFKPTKEQLEMALGQRVMDYKVDGEEVNFSIRPEEFGYNTDRGWYADFSFDALRGELLWIPDIPTECLSPNVRIKNMDELVSALETYGDWEPWEGEDDDSEIE